MSSGRRIPPAGRIPEPPAAGAGLAGRRELLLGAAGAGLALPLLARAALAQGNGDRALLADAIGLELRLAAAYGAAVSFESAGLFRDQSRAHGRGLEEALRNRGGRAPAPPPAPGSEPGRAELLRLETRAAAAYYRAHEGLRDATLLPTFASLMANHAQHLVVLRQALGREPLPVAFVTGGVE